MKEKKSCKVVYNRRKDLEKRGVSKVEIHVRLASGVRTYVPIKDCSADEYFRFSKSSELRTIIAKYERTVSMMDDLCEEMTVENFQQHAGIISIKEKEN